MERAAPISENSPLAGVLTDSRDYTPTRTLRKDRSTVTLEVEVAADPKPVIISVTGRDAWALEQLLAAGEGGCTPITDPGPRWSHYVCKLRKKGLEIETVEVPHAGPYPGCHGRYVLRSVCRVVRRVEQNGRA